MSRCSHAKKYIHEYGIRPLISWCENCGAFKADDPWRRKKWKTPKKTLLYDEEHRHDNGVKDDTDDDKFMNDPHIPQFVKNDYILGKKL